MTGDDLIAHDGYDKLDADGNDVLDDGAGDHCNCGCGASGSPRYGCGNSNTCNKFCDPGHLDFERGPDCDCPCPGRLGLPPGWLLSWGVTLAGGKHVSFGSPPGDPRHWELTTQLGHIFQTYRWPEGCMTESGICHPGEDQIATPVLNGWEHVEHETSDGGDPDDPESHDVGHFNVWWNSSGNLHGSGPGFFFSFDLAADCDRIRFTAAFQDGTGFPSGVNPDGTASTDSLLVSIDSGWVSRCQSGSGGAVTYSTNPASRLIGGVDELTWTPVCNNCAGDRIGQGTDPASICGGKITLSVQLSDGTIDTFFLTGGPDFWSGGGTYCLATISTRGQEDVDEKCCPNRDPSDCVQCGGDDTRPGASCEQCWNLRIEVSGGAPGSAGAVANYWNRGSCPPDAGWRLHTCNIAEVPTIAAIGFTGDCPVEEI